MLVAQALYVGDMEVDIETGRRAEVETWVMPTGSNDEATLRAVCQARGATLTIHQTQSFRPGRPTPTHRYAAAR